MSTGSRLTLLIDADDTLWENDQHYKASTTRFIALMAGLGAETSAAQALIDACEREQIAIGGFGPTSFTAALLAAAEQMLSVAAQPWSEAVAAQVRACTARLFDDRVELFPEVAATVPVLAAAHTLVLVTKGEERFQLAKLAGSGLAPHFQAARVLRHKDVAAYAELVDELQLERATTWMVGNSPRSDINPALEAGLGAVYIPNHHTWHQEIEPLHQSTRLVTLTSFAELPQLFAARPSAWQPST